MDGETRTNKNIIIAMPDLTFAEQMKKNFESRGFKVVEIIVVLEHLIPTIDEMVDKGSSIYGIIISSSVAKNIQGKRLEMLSQTLLNVREKHADIGIIFLSNEDEGHPLLAELVSFGIYNIFTRKTSKTINIDELVKLLHQPKTFSDVKHFREINTDIQWGNQVPVLENTKAKTEKEGSPKNQDQKENNQKKKPRNEDPIADIEFELPIEREKLVVVETIVGVVLITIVGVEQVAGSTHTTLLITNYLVRKGYTVAVIEASEKQDFEALEMSYEGQKIPSPELKVHIAGADYFKSGYELDMSHFKGYNYIVLDLGYYGDSPYMDEFKRSNVQIIVGHASEWRQRRIYDFSREHAHLDQRDWNFCIPFSEEQSIGDISKELGTKKVYSLPAHPDPYKHSKASDAVFETILKNVLGQKRKKNHTGVLYGIIVASMLVIITLIFLLIQK